MNDRLEQARELGQRIDAGWRRPDVEAQLDQLHVRMHRNGRRRAIAAPLVAAMATAAVLLGIWATGRLRQTDRGITAAPVATRSTSGPSTVTDEPPRSPSETVAVAPAPAVVAEVRHEHDVVAASQPRAVATSVREQAAVLSRDERSSQSPQAPRVPEAAPASTWREQAERGDYAAAWTALAGGDAALDGMDDLLRIGDIARLSGHAGAAVAPLVRALALHPDDPRAPLAAFTLGRVYLDDLGAPRDAALVFARAHQLSPEGPLAEDALAREVEAWSRAGETETARARASLYVQHYPRGRRVHAVRKFGGLERP